MAIGFRKSLVGFKCSDVMNYIESSHKTQAENEKKLKTEITDLNSNIESLNNTIRILTEERNKIAERLKEFDEKYEEIDRLAENIGKLYLVAQNNATAIMKNTNDNSEITNAEIEKNISTIAETQDALNTIRTEMADVNQNFSSKLEDLLESLSETREKITENTVDTKSRNDNFNEVMAMLNNQ